jgi:hypothetical protein
VLRPDAIRRALEAEPANLRELGQLREVRDAAGVALDPCDRELGDRLALQDAAAGDDRRRVADQRVRKAATPADLRTTSDAGIARPAVAVAREQHLLATIAIRIVVGSELQMDELAARIGALG